jgi:F0F1-type ATP synthase assembly protein I
MEKQPQKPSKPKSSLSNIYGYFSLGFQAVFATGVMGYLGHLADDKLKISFPIFLLLGIIVGLTASVMKILKQLNDK